MVNLLNLRNEILEKEVQFRILKQEKEKIIQELSKSRESVESVESVGSVSEEKNTQENAL